MALKPLHQRQGGSHWRGPSPHEQVNYQTMKLKADAESRLKPDPSFNPNLGLNVSHCAYFFQLLMKRGVHTTSTVWQC